MDDDFIRRFFGGSSKRDGDNFGLFGGNHADEFNSEFGRMFAEMERTMREFHQANSIIMGGFGDKNSAAHDSELPSIEWPVEEENTKLRDSFLKPEGGPAKNNDKSNEAAVEPFNPGFGLRSRIFDRFIYPGFDNNDKNKAYVEENLDEKVKRDGFDKVIGEDVLKSEPSASSKQPFTFSSWGQSVSVRRVHKPDGTIEEIKTVKDSSGKNETVTTRIIGEKVHSITEKRGRDGGVHETEETFQNFDENEIGGFNQMWSNLSRPKKQLPPAEPATRLDQSRNGNATDDSIIGKVMSWLFKK